MKKKRKIEIYIVLAGAAQWKKHYDHPDANVHPVMSRCHLNFGNPSVYWINNSKPSPLYAFLQEWEEAKLARPSQPNVLSTWIQVETVDGYPLSQYRFPNPAGEAQIDLLKPQVPASSTYALSLFGHCVMGVQFPKVGSPCPVHPRPFGRGSANRNRNRAGYATF